MDAAKLETARLHAVAECQANAHKMAGPIADPIMGKVMAEVLDGIAKYGAPFLLAFLSKYTP